MSYSKYTISELKEICKRFQIKGYNKINLIDLLKTHTLISEFSELKIDGVSDTLSISPKNITCPKDVIDGRLITKEKRQELFGKVSGGSGSRKPEIFQRQRLIDGTGYPCSRTNVRINLRTNTLVNICCPNKRDDGFDYSEDFDGCQYINNKKIYINLKCIVGKGGSQTRSLREVYWFVEGQLKVLNSVEDTYFANILDGDEAHYSMSKFDYIVSRHCVGNKIYIGDLKGYFEWFKKV